MKNTLFSLITLIVFLISAPFSNAQKGTASLEEMIKLTQPGAEHELLAIFEGVWEQEIHIFFRSDTVSVTKGTGKITNQFVLGSRYIQSIGSSIAFGMHISSITYIGFDKRFGKYSMFTMDELGTYAVNSLGEYVDEEASFIFEGNALDPVTSEYLNFKMIYRIESEDRIIYNLFFIMPDNTQFKYIEAIYKRIE
ncbi:MAG: DUF1579 family protein [Ignavibacteriaceae bacterium]|nr:DUF1579 family protein [Ignavibacteriaceae bacterium]